MSTSSTKTRPRPASKSAHRSRRPEPEASGKNGADAACKPAASSGAGEHPKGKTSWFTTFAHHTAHLAGKPVAFLLATATILVWAVTGPLFGYSDTWQLVINTGTTIVTFLMVFLIQNSQNRDSLAFQIKLDELIIAMRGAENKMAGAEDLCDADLEALHDAYRKRASETLETLDKRRDAK